MPTKDDLGLAQVFRDLQAQLPQDAVVTFGAGNHAIWAQRYLRHRAFPSQLAARNGSMGYGVPAAMAASLAFPNRTVVSVAGDGWFLMNGQELSTAVTEGAAPIILVVNNGMYGTIRQHQELRHPGRVSGTHTGELDFATYARAFGGHGEVVTQTEEFRPALERALHAGAPAVIDLRANLERLTPNRARTRLPRIAGARRGHKVVFTGPSAQRKG